MKIRNGFVSNSSSTSFMIVGICIDINEFLGRQNSVFNGYNKRYNVEDIVLKSTSLEVFGAFDDPEVCIGLSPDKMKDSETLLDLKKKAVSEFKKLNISVKVKDIVWLKGEYRD